MTCTASPELLTTLLKKDNGFGATAIAVQKHLGYNILPFGAAPQMAEQIARELAPQLTIRRLPNLKFEGRELVYWVIRTQSGQFIAAYESEVGNEFMERVNEAYMAETEELLSAQFAGK